VHKEEDSNHRAIIYWLALFHRAAIKKKERRKKPQGKNIMSASATQGGHKQKEELQCGIMPNVITALQNIGGALC